MPRKVHVVINPAAGEAQPILHILNKVFQAAGAECDISVTKASGDAERFARAESIIAEITCPEILKSRCLEFFFSFWFHLQISPFLFRLH